MIVLLDAAIKVSIIVLVALAAARLMHQRGDHPRRVADDPDVTLDAFTVSQSARPNAASPTTDFASRRHIVYHRKRGERPRR